MASLPIALVADRIDPLGPGDGKGLGGGYLKTDIAWWGVERGPPSIENRPRPHHVRRRRLGHSIGLRVKPSGGYAPPPTGDRQPSARRRCPHAPTVLRRPLWYRSQRRDPRPDTAQAQRAGRRRWATSRLFASRPEG